MVLIPGLLDMRALQSLLAALGLNVMAILSSMQGGIPMHHIPQHAPQPLLAALPPPAPVIDPQPQAEPPLNALNHVLQWLETIEKLLKHPQHDEDNDADDEGDMRQCKKPRKDGKFILNTWTDQLMPAQKTICAELQDRICVVIYNLTGIVASNIRKPKDLDDEDSSDNEDETQDDRLLMFDF
ncbi:uncharacterized protein BJ212DRAFT_1480760 [Suillus subaureus]|uniref:Uncharacterized protein n=1 Tax=Suillus subaureus TaxID=48587 RepID=A0A9P7JDM4_9AGAM|nr:uncharacterized protein BJ212DRAFT_1480760 [Suillus subaureus]KAG1816311.1 hypothetical protein BJ212DRAFT_1480760 [Suillus subaureus]